MAFRRRRRGTLQGRGAVLVHLDPCSGEADDGAKVHWSAPAHEGRLGPCRPPRTAPRGRRGPPNERYPDPIPGVTQPGTTEEKPAAPHAPRSDATRPQRHQCDDPRREHHGVGRLHTRQTSLPGSWMLTEGAVPMECLRRSNPNTGECRQGCYERISLRNDSSRYFGLGGTFLSTELAPGARINDPPRA